MNKIAILDNGTAYNLVALHQEPFNQYFERVIYYPKITKADLDGIDVLIVTCLSNIDHHMQNKELFMDFLAQGKTLVVMARNEPYKWLPDIEGMNLPFNYWWWLNTNDEKFQLKVDDENHPLFNEVNFKDMIWHFHDGYKVPTGARSAVRHKEEDASIYFELDDYYGGRLVVTALDPFFHHGSYFMPNSSVFGEKLLRYLKTY